MEKISMEKIALQAGIKYKISGKVPRDIRAMQTINLVKSNLKKYIALVNKTKKATGLSYKSGEFSNVQKNIESGNETIRMLTDMRKNTFPLMIKAHGNSKKTVLKKIPKEVF